MQRQTFKYRNIRDMTEIKWQNMTRREEGNQTRGKERNRSCVATSFQHVIRKYTEHKGNEFFGGGGAEVTHRGSLPWVTSRLPPEVTHGNFWRESKVDKVAKNLKIRKQKL